MARPVWLRSRTPPTPGPRRRTPSARLLPGLGAVGSERSVRPRSLVTPSPSRERTYRRASGAARSGFLRRERDPARFAGRGPAREGLRSHSGPIGTRPRDHPASSPTASRCGRRASIAGRCRDSGLRRPARRCRRRSGRGRSGTRGAIRRPWPRGSWMLKSTQVGEPPRLAPSAFRCGDRWRSPTDSGRGFRGAGSSIA